MGGAAGEYSRRPPPGPRSRGAVGFFHGETVQLETAKGYLKGIFRGFSGDSQGRAEMSNQRLMLGGFTLMPNVGNLLVALPSLWGNSTV